MRWLYLIAFACAHAFVFAQEKELTISTTGVHSDVGTKDIVNAANGLKDSIQLNDELRNPALDSIKKLNEIAVKQKIFSQKHWKHFYDSLSKAIGAPPLARGLRQIEVTEDQLIEALNQKFYGSSKDSIDNLREPFRNIATMPNGSDEFTNKVPGIPTGYNVLPAINSLTLPTEALQNLSPLPGSTMKSKFLTKLDSIRRINLIKEGLQVDEIKISPEQVVTEFSPKQRFWDKTYFEGVIGFTPGDFKIFQASPTMGYHFRRYLSAGLGPNVLVQQQSKSVVSTVGIKTFFKAEFLKRQAYFQLEDIMDSYGKITTSESQGNILKEHNVFVGGGFLLDIHAPFTLNFSILYCVTENDLISHEFSPMVLRIGLSSLKIKN